MKTIRTSGVYRSELVSRDASHHHKTWSCEVIETDNGDFLVRSHAQLFVETLGAIYPEQKRTYEMGLHTRRAEAERELERRVQAKKSGKSKYTLMWNPENDTITADEATIMEFLKKYSLQST